MNNRYLSDFLEDRKGKGAGLGVEFPTLCGVYYAFACSPEFLPPRFVYEVPFEGEPPFGDMAEMNRVTKALGELYGQIQGFVNKRTAEPPPGYESFRDAPVESIFEGENELSKWSDGFIVGRSYTEKVWQKHAGEYDIAEHDRCVMTLSFFSDPEVARGYHELFPPPFSQRETSFEEFSRTMFENIPEAVASYAEMGRSIYEAALRKNIKNPKKDD